MIDVAKRWHDRYAVVEWERENQRVSETGQHEKQSESAFTQSLDALGSRIAKGPRIRSLSARSIPGLPCLPVQNIKAY